MSESVEEPTSSTSATSPPDSRASTPSTISLPEKPADPLTEDPPTYVVVQISSSGGDDDLTQYTTKDSTEIVELSWSIINSEDMKEICHGRSVVRPINAPITPGCSSVTGLTWESVREAGTLQDAVTELDRDIQDNLVSKNRPFTFVTFNSWDLRMRLPKEAREKAIQLPQYLKYPRYFDLRREYLRQQEQVEPGSTLSNSDPMLYEVAESLGVSQEKPVGYENTLATLKAILQKLVDPSKSKPHDMGLDLAHFYTEQSRVLYVRNLSIDVTQGELESWFAQFGCRPIAFWTIKAPLPEFNGMNGGNNGNMLMLRATCSGFVIFAIHDAAADSLAMNGRILNDRIVEVQPSSAKVLDKAQEILTPFPSSKNRPRPGDWTCPSCGFSNFQRRTACFRCSFPVASTQTPQDSMYGNSQSGGYYNGGHTHHPTHPSHHQPHHQYYNNRGQSLGSSNVPFRAGDWKCTNENCAYHNFAKNVCCLKCGAPRVQSAILTGHAHNPHHNNSSNNNNGGSSSPSSQGYSGRSYSQGYQKPRYYNQSQGSQNQGQQGYSQFMAQLSTGSTPNTPLFPEFDSLSQQISNLNLSQTQPVSAGSNGTQSSASFYTAMSNRSGSALAEKNEC